MTHRQYLTWQAWLADQWNQPSRSDHYLMRIARHCHQALTTSRSVTEDEEKVVFVFGKDNDEKGESKSGPMPGAKPMTKETITAIQKSIWRQRMGEPISSTPPKSS